MNSSGKVEKFPYYLQQNSLLQMKLDTAILDRCNKYLLMDRVDAIRVLVNGNDMDLNRLLTPLERYTKDCYDERQKKIDEFGRSIKRHILPKVTKGSI